MTDFEIGSLVSYQLLYAGTGYVIGRMAYSENVLLIASDDYIGMAINKVHCKETGATNRFLAMKLREKYIKRCGEDKLMELE